MDRKPCSIFNEALGPIMTGPSSSHTAGPARIGKVAHMLLDNEVEEIKILFDVDGSYAATYRAQGSDYGFVGGILGIDISDENIKQALKVAKEKNVSIEFKIEKVGGDIHPNFARLNLKDKKGATLCIESASTGGGTFEVTKYEKFPVSLKGDCYEILVVANKIELEEEVKRIFDKTNFSYETELVVVKEEENCLINIKTDTKVSHEIISELKELSGVIKVKYVKPVLPVVKKNEYKMPFLYATDALVYAKENNLSLWEIACDYEAAISGKSQEEIIEMMINVENVMRKSGIKGVEGNYEKRGFLPPQGAIMAKNMKKENARMIDMGILNQVMLWATSIMEYDICRGTIVAAPTGGSCGVIPGAIVSVGDQLGYSEVDIAKALLVTGLIGVFIDHKATFAAEVCGCQAENGAASSMAAAGIVQLLGGSVEEGFAAASLALQNLLGLICDPVAGVGNVPCVSRNPMGALNGILSANMVLNGFDPYIPLDETITAMMEVGRLMPREHRCTGLGGLCTTPTGLKALEEFNLNASN